LRNKRPEGRDSTSLRPFRYSNATQTRTPAWAVPPPGLFALSSAPRGCGWFDRFSAFRCRLGAFLFSQRCHPCRRSPAALSLTFGESFQGDNGLFNDLSLLAKVVQNFHYIHCLAPLQAARAGQFSTGLFRKRNDVAEWRPPTRHFYRTIAGKTRGVLQIQNKTVDHGLAAPILCVFVNRRFQFA